jgi:hypothetical protein
MGHTPHPSRREILRSIWGAGSGGLLLPWTVLRGQSADPRPPGVIRGRILDGATGNPVPAKLRVINTESGQVHLAERAIRTMPKRSTRPTRQYFYARGSYEIAVPPGRYRIEAVRGICHEAAVVNTEIGSGLTHVHDLRVTPPTSPIATPSAACRSSPATER